MVTVPEPAYLGTGRFQHKHPSFWQNLQITPVRACQVWSQGETVRDCEDEGACVFDVRVLILA